MKNFTLSILSALCLVSCKDNTEPIFLVPRQEKSRFDTVIEITARYPMRDLDILVYSNENVRKLILHNRINFDGNIFRDTLELSEGPYILAAIANSPGKLNDAALQRYDALEELSFPFVTENPNLPSMSGVTAFSTGENVILNTDPLTCRISIEGIQSEINLYDLKVRLLNVPASCEVLRWSGFHANEMLQDTNRQSFPEMTERQLEGYFDWRYELNPNITFNCYPNDSDTEDIGSPRTRLQLTGHVLDDKIVSYEEELSMLRRAEDMLVWIKIEDYYHWRVTQSPITK